MNKSDFTIFTLCQDLTVDPANITATYDALNSFLNIPVKFLLRQPSEDIWYEIDTITAKLLVNNTLISTTTEYTRFAINMQQKREEKDDSQVFSFNLSRRAIEAIEKARQGDANLKIEFRGSLRVLNIYRFPKNGGTIQIASPYGFMGLHSDMYLSIPQSQWGNKILPGLNYSSFVLIEVPLTHKTLKEAYDNIAKEFVKAENYFKEHKYYECVGACRKTMDKLNENMRNLKDKIGSASNYKWLEEINTNTFTWIDSMKKSNSGLTSKPHHQGDHTYERHEAEAIYLVTLGLMNFIAYLK